MEACRDAAQCRMAQEVYELDESIEALTNQLRAAENQMQALQVCEAVLVVTVGLFGGNKFYNIGNMMQ